MDNAIISNMPKGNRKNSNITTVPTTCKTILTYTVNDEQNLRLQLHSSHVYAHSEG